MTSRAAVLVVDDEVGVRDMLAHELSDRGFEVETADSGRSAIEAMRRRKFDLAITDLNMPDMSGVETVSALRAINPDIQVIVATGYATVETGVACIRQGAYGYIQKPFELDQVMLLLERAMEHGNLQRVVALYEASRALVGTLKFSELTEQVMTLAGSVLEASHVELTLQDVPISDQGTGRAIPATLLTNLIAMVSVTDAPLRIPTPQQGWPAGTPKEFESALIYPLVTRSQTIGHLVVVRTHGQPQFSESELRRGAIFAGQIAISLDSACLYEELEGNIREQVETREQLVRAEKLGAVVDLAAYVAHEVNNPLSYVQANLYSLRDYSKMVSGLWSAAKATAESLKDSGGEQGQRMADDLLSAGGLGGVETENLVREIAEMIEDIFGGVKRVSDLVAGLRRLAEPPSPSVREAMEVSTLVTSAVQRANSKLAIAQDCAGAGMIWVAAADIRSVIVNLLTYLDAQRAGRQEPALSLTCVVKAGRVVLSLVDPGLQLSEEERLGILDPKLMVDVQNGRTMRLDLGMSLAHLLIRRNDGSLSITSDAEKGTLIRIELPGIEPHGWLPHLHPSVE